MADFQSLFSYFEAFVDTRTIFLCLLVFLVVSWVARRYFNQNEIPNLPPGPRGWPLLGSIPQILLKATKIPINELFQSLSEKYGPVCHLPLPMGKRAVVITGYQAVHESLTSSEFSWRPPMPKESRFGELMNGRGVFMASGETWKEHRRFSLTVLRGFGVGKRSFEGQIATESECLLKEIKALNGGPFDPTNLFGNAVNNIISSVVLGKRFEYDDPEFKHLLFLLHDSTSHIGMAMIIMSLPFLLRIPFFPKGPIPSLLSLRQKLKDIVDDHHATFDNKNLRDFIDVYINELQVKKDQGIETHLSDVELRVTVSDFFNAGTETTSTTLRWGLLYMLNFPDVQKRVHDEIDRVVGRDRLPKLSDKPNLPYTEAVIHEIQRYGCIALFTFRYASQDIQFQGFTIPKDSYIFIDYFNATRDPSVWDNPGEFQPERFLDEHGQVETMSGSLVFGAGKRSCLGEQLARMELFIFFTHLMHQFSFKKPNETETLNIRPKPGGVLSPFPYSICATVRT